MKNKQKTLAANLLTIPSPPCLHNQYHYFSWLLDLCLDLILAVFILVYQNLFIYFFIYYINSGSKLKSRYFPVHSFLLQSKSDVCLYYRFPWIERDIKSHLINSCPLDMSRAAYQKIGFSGPRAYWPQAILRMGHLQFLWATCSSASQFSE